MQLTLGKLVESTPALNELILLKLKASAAWDVAEVIRITNPKVEDFNKVKLEILKEFGTSEDGRNYKITDENLPLFTAELETLTSKIIDLGNIEKIKVSTLGDNLDVEPRVFLPLDWLIEK